MGNDAFGQVIRDRFAAIGVSDALVRTVDGVPTGSAFVAYNSDGSRDFVFNIAHSAASHLPVDDEAVETFAAFGLDACSCDTEEHSEILVEVVAGLKREARAVFGVGIAKVFVIQLDGASVECGAQVEAAGIGLLCTRDRCDAHRNCSDQQKLPCSFH